MQGLSSTYYSSLIPCLMTSIHTSRKSESHEYPGVYHPPMYNWARVMQQLKDTPSTRLRPSVRISETSDFYSIELNAPGFSKEDFIVTINNGRLSIYGLSSACSTSGHSVSHNQDSVYDCFEHILELPRNIDSDFVRAEYNSGVLRFDFPKTSVADKCTVDRIIVY